MLNKSLIFLENTYSRVQNDINFCTCNEKGQSIKYLAEMELFDAFEPMRIYKEKNAINMIRWNTFFHKKL
jgi:hypothetical protein